MTSGLTILIQVLIGQFSNSVFWLSADDIKMNFGLNMCISMEFDFNAFQKKFFHITDFGVRNVKIIFLAEKNGLPCSFYQIKVYMLLYWSSGLKKKAQNTWNLAFGSFCTHFLKIAFSEIFPRFWKIIPSTCKNHCRHSILPENGRLTQQNINQSILRQ